MQPELESGNAMASYALASHYARCLAERIDGHPLFDPEPHDPHDAFHVEGTELFDVAWIDSRGNLRYAFSASLGPNDNRNLDNTHRSLLPPRHERYTGCRPGVDINFAAKLRDCYRSLTVEGAEISGNVSVPIAPGETPVGVNATLGYSISDQAAALLFVPQDHKFLYAGLENMAANYARKHTASWYRHLNGKNGHHAVRNGELYFVTSCYKVKEWHTLCAYSSSTSRRISVQFHPVPDVDVGFTGSYVCESSGVQPQKGPVAGVPEKETQCAAVGGWKLALCARFVRFAKVPVEVNKAAESTLGSKAMQRPKWAPYSSSQTALSDQPPPSTNASSTQNHSMSAGKVPSSRSLRHMLGNDPGLMS